MKKGRGLGLLVAGLVIVQVLGGGSPATATRDIGWKGGESFSPVALAPNLQRCGAPPANLEATFTGSGIDTEGGAFNVVASACLNTDTFRVTTLRATDTFTKTGDQVNIVTDDFTMSYDEATCVLTNRRPVEFRVAGGSGALEGASGRGTFDMTMTWPECGGQSLSVFVWFEGALHVPE